VFINNIISLIIYFQPSQIIIITENQQIYHRILVGNINSNEAIKFHNNCIY